MGNKMQLRVVAKKINFSTHLGMMIIGVEATEIIHEMVSAVEKKATIAD